MKKGGEEGKATLFVTEKTLDDQLYFSGMLQVIVTMPPAPHK